MKAHQNHPRDPLRLYGISRKKERRERCQNPKRARIIRKNEWRKERDVKLQIELEAMIDKKIKYTIQTQIEDRFLGFKNELQQWMIEFKKWENINNQPKKEGLKKITSWEIGLKS